MHKRHSWPTWNWNPFRQYRPTPADAEPRPSLNQPPPAEADDAQLIPTLTYLYRLRDEWECGKAVSVSVLPGSQPDRQAGPVIITCNDTDAHLFSAPLHSLIALSERQLDITKQ